MKRFLFRYFVRSLRWMAVSFIFKKFLRSKASSSADKAMSRLEDSVSAPVQSTLAALPSGARQVAGSAVIAVNIAKKSAALGQAAPKALAKGSTIAFAPLRFFRAIPARFKEEISLAEREVRSDYLREAVGEQDAIDALLDSRVAEIDVTEPVVPAAVSPGRKRARRPRREKRVSRVQRSYQPEKSRWH